MFKSSPSKENDDQREQNAHNNPDVCFYERMAATFTGLRGLNKVDVGKLCAFFEDIKPIDDISPMTLIEKIGRYPINQFRDVNDYLLIGNTEVVVNKDRNIKEYNSNEQCFGIYVYRHPENKNIQFLFIICPGQDPVHYYEEKKLFKMKDVSTICTKVKKYKNMSLKMIYLTKQKNSMRTYHFMIGNTSVRLNSSIIFINN